MSAIENAKELLHTKECACVVLTADGTELILNGQGISPIVNLLRENPQALQGATVADKVIGKAAAMLLAYGGALTIWGDIMSSGALKYLKASKISAAYEKLVPVLKNRAGTHQCPMETRAAELKTSQEAFLSFVTI